MVHEKVRQHLISRSIDYLRIFYHYITFVADRVSDAGVRFVIENSPGSQLRELNLTNCSKISDVTILRMSQW